VRCGVLALETLLELAEVVRGIYRNFDIAGVAGIEKEPVHAFRSGPSDASDVVAKQSTSEAACRPDVEQFVGHAISESVRTRA
jgi:hypothetical protein